MRGESPRARPVETGLELLDGGEVEEALGAGAEFPGGLGAAQKEDADDGDVAAVELEVLGQIVPVFLDPGAGAEDDGNELLVAEAADASSRSSHRRR